MNKTLLTIAICLITLGSLSAQSFIGKLNPYPNKNSRVIAGDTLKILAAMVSFQEDRDGATFGNGKFGSIYSKDYSNDILDPLPHEKNYFESHLTFVKNYYQKVSNGKTNISFTILPDTFSVSKTMRNYAPVSSSNDFTPLGQFAQEVWTKADQMNPGFNFSDYDVFLIFHAGAGRDISLPGSIGNERDLPSVYLNDNAFKNIFGQNFDGFSVSNGSFKIRNSMIIPETESRELETISGKFLFEITINGLLVASVASHLGLPDLFDTETGLSAIGRFGLMDGQSIFAYNGVFPPEPSAWEKIYLEWVVPTEISIENNTINLTANLAATLSDTVILKVPLNSSEYYLIENRQRDVSSDGANLTYKSGGNIINRTFLKDTSGFYSYDNSYDTDSLSGVVLDVDEFDWALPGNGIVIWHIDENVIDEKLASNKINTDKTKRGVDVEEADGIQDIGEKFITIFGDEVIGEGTEQDFWFNGNKAPLFKNKFAKDTRPDTKTNSGANSLITIKNFSSISNKMSFKIEYGDSVIKPLFSSNLLNIYANKLTVIDDNSDSPLFGLVSSDLLLTDGQTVLQTLPDFAGFQKVASTKINDKVYIIGGRFNRVNYWLKENSITVQGSFETRYQISTAPIIRKNIDNTYDLIFGTTAGIILIYDLESINSSNPILKDSIIIEPLASIIKISASTNSIFAIANSINNSSDAYYYATGSEKMKFNRERFVDLVSSIDKDGNYYSVLLTENNKIYVVYSGKILSSFEVNSSLPISSISFADIKQDGENYILVNTITKILAYNLSGVLADNFPLYGNSLIGLVYSPLAADIEGNSINEILFADNYGNVYAYDAVTSKLVDGFPITLGGILATQPILFNYKNKIALAGISDGYFTAWEISSVYTKPNWAEENGNNQNTSFVDAAKSTNTINQFFPSNRAYNYPNPVYDGQTAIRYYVGEDSKINIKIFDLAGDYVAEINDDAQGGMDNETEWNVENVQSGVYLTRIEAAGVSGKTESVVIKIAVVK